MPTLKTCVICGGEFQARTANALTCSPAHRRELECERARERYAANPERVLARQGGRYAANPERARERQRGMYAANPERERERAREWRAANRAWLNERGREVWFQKSLAYQFLKLHGPPLDHLPTKGSRLWFSYKLLRDPERILTTTQPTGATND